MMSDYERRQLQQLWESRQRPEKTLTLKKNVDRLLRQLRHPRRKRLATLTAAWEELMPQGMREHAVLQRFERGCLTVLVNDAGCQYELDLLLKEGLLLELQTRCPGVNLSRVTVRRGRLNEIVPDPREDRQR